MLSDLRVLDLTDERGFLAGKILADLGADVIKIEPPGGDPARDRGPFLGAASRESSLPWLALNTSKRGISLALDSARGREVFLSLVRGCDVVLESFAPGTLERWGVGFDEMTKSCPGVIVCAITPFGQSGPYAEYQAHDLIVVAMGGNAILTGDPERPPVRCSMPTSYYHAAPTAVFGILTALHAVAMNRDEGPGQFVDVSMQECQLATLMTGPGQFAHTGRLGSRQGERLGLTREIWQAKDGYVTFGLRGGPTRIPNLIAMVEHMKEHACAPDWLIEFDWAEYSPMTAKEEELVELEQVFAAFFRTRSMAQLYEVALERRILLAPCNDAREILKQKQLRDRELFVTLEYPELGASIEHPGFFARSSEFSIGVRGRAPRIGEHNREIYADLGISPSELDALIEQGVI
jgi:benzylsuccinate CoA-transferase BbsE subunit